MGVAMALRILDIGKSIIQTSNSKRIGHRGKNEQLSCLVRGDGGGGGIGCGIEKNVVVLATKALERLEKHILRDEKFIFGYQCLINLFQIPTSSDNVDMFGQLNIFIIIGNNHIFRLFFPDQHFKRAEKALAWNPKMECCSMIHVEIPDKTLSSHLTKRSG